MEFNTRYSVEDEVYDTISKTKVVVIGFNLKHGICGEAPEHYHTCIEYYVKNDLIEGWRTEYELTKRTLATPTVRPVTQNKAA
jgi:hypothetical protein